MRPGEEAVMPRIGTEKRPAVVRVKNMLRADEVMRVCNKHDWKVIVGIEPDKPENLHDLNWLLRRKKIPLPESLKN
jgi:hypothetical protein